MTNQRGIAAGLLVLVWSVLGCSEADSVPGHADFEVGMERAAILATFGPPDHEQTLLKQSEAIWGPIEDFWPQVPTGAKIEVWSYESQARLVEGSDETTRGSTELYFVDESTTVQGVGFAPDGVVY